MFKLSVSFKLLYVSKYILESHFN